MIEYIKQLARSVANHERPSSPALGLEVILGGLSEELDRLDPRDFAIDAQYEFVTLRLRVRKLARQERWSGAGEAHEIAKLGRIANELLDKYGGFGSHVRPIQVTFITDPLLRDIIERDYRELALILLPGGAWKSSVILAGSILEAVLYGLLTADAAITAQAEGSVKAPKGKKLTDGRWTLADLLSVAVDLKFITSAREAEILKAVRDCRNLVHPKKELIEQHPVQEAEAFMAKAALDGLIALLAARP